MYKQLLFASTLSLGLAVAPAAMARPDAPAARGHGPDRGHVVDGRHSHDGGRRGHDHVSGRDDRRHHDRDRHDERDGRDDRRGHDRNGWQELARERHWRESRFHVAPYRAPRGYYHHAWRAGERLPAGYRHTRYVVHDYRDYRLYAPPRGHQWVRVDHDVVLTALATGVVAAVVYNLFA